MTDADNFDEVALNEMIDKIASLTPLDDTDYSMGYHTSLMYLKRYLRGKDPFKMTFNNGTISIEITVPK